ncbi:hypothetical protein [Enterococcus casseliflavus]|uniref:hypothetical protein n=1 Tax=Enterococcus casseliflavus TaxID=37734 RepID=UPI0022E73602|nr:hypothetical protein [Enterococcus casseliflavus]
MKDNGDSQYSPFDEECEFYQKSINDIINRTCLKTIVFEIIKGFARNVEENHFKAWFISLIKNIAQNKITYLKNDGF